MEFKNDVEAVDSLHKHYEQLVDEINKIVIGQNEVIKDVLITIFAKGHCLLVGVPGLAKTLLVNTVASVLGLNNNRVQFTPDLMPSDIIGTEILDDKKNFKFIKGPLFSNFILADEINRTPPKTQAALLEAMQERSVTAGGISYPLPDPFFVLATQNPIEQEGTYPLPEAQLDRFMFNIWVDYPSFKDEMTIVKETTSSKKISLNPLLDAESIKFYQTLIRKVPVNDNVVEYAVKLVAKTRKNSEFAPSITKEFLTWGAGPRASQNLIIGAKTNAVLKGKYSPDIEDVKAVALQTLRHRLVKNYKAEAEGVSIDNIISELMK